MIAQLKKTYLHKPIKILNFLTPVRIEKCLRNVQNILAILTINLVQAESRI